MRNAPRVEHDSYRTEQAHVGRSTRHAEFRDKRRAKEWLQPSYVQHRMAVVTKYGRIHDLAKETNKPRKVLWAARPSAQAPPR